MGNLAKCNNRIQIWNVAEIEIEGVEVISSRKNSIAMPTATIKHRSKCLAQQGPGNSSQTTSAPPEHPDPCTTSLTDYHPLSSFRLHPKSLLWQGFWLRGYLAAFHIPTVSWLHNFSAACNFNAILDLICNQKISQTNFTLSTVGPWWAVVVLLLLLSRCRCRCSCFCFSSCSCCCSVVKCKYKFNEAVNCKCQAMKRGEGQWLLQKALRAAGWWGQIFICCRAQILCCILSCAAATQCGTSRSVPLPWERSPTRGQWNWGA